MDKFDSEPQYHCEQFKSCHGGRTASFVAAAFPTAGAHHHKSKLAHSKPKVQYYPGTYDVTTGKPFVKHT